MAQTYCTYFQVSVAAKLEYLYFLAKDGFLKGVSTGTKHVLLLLFFNESVKV